MFSILKSYDPWGVVTFDPYGQISTHLVKNHYMMLHANDYTSLLCCCRKDVKNLFNYTSLNKALEPNFYLRSMIRTNMEEEHYLLSRTAYLPNLYDATCQILNL